jgi:hypothetical protein
MKRSHTLILSIMVAFLAVGCTTLSTSGDYTLESGQTLQGNLVITSGDATLEEDSRVTGDVLITSGNLEANGQIDGNIVMSSGDIALGPKAVVQGSIRATSGDIHRAEGAQVQGQVSTNQSTFPIGGGIIAGLVGLLCILPCLAIAGLILLLAVVARRKSTPTAVAEKPAPTDTSTQKLQQLKQLLDQDLITEAEYEDKKAEILADM